MHVIRLRWALKGAAVSFFPSSLVVTRIEHLVGNLVQRSKMEVSAATSSFHYGVLFTHANYLEEATCHGEIFLRITQVDKQSQTRFRDDRHIHASLANDYFAIAMSLWYSKGASTAMTP